MNQDNRLWNSQQISFLASLGLLLLLCSKSYYLFGVDNSNRPIAPVALVLMRDIFTVAFIGFFGFQLRQYLKNLRLFWILFAVGLLISLLQLAVAKDFMTWSQHYLRNILMPLLLYPVFVGIFRVKIDLSARQILNCLFVVSVFLSYMQIYYSKWFIRPTGLFGDPIINSMFLLLGFVSILLSRGKMSVLLASIALVPLIQYLSSLSALFSVIAGAGTVFLLSKNQWLEYCRTHTKKVLLTAIGSICLIAFLGWTTQHTHRESQDDASDKAQALFKSIFCKQEGCQHWSYKGRIESNLRPFRLCQEDAVSCVVGNIQTPLYEKVESTWGSLVANWGAIFCLLYLFWALKHLLKARKLPLDLSDPNPDLVFWSVVLFTGAFFCILNTVPYKYPVNILWYASLAFITVTSESIRSSQRDR